MTAQIRERLIYKGREYFLATEPLSPYLKSKNIKFTYPSTACWRGYIGNWVIKDNKLYLTELEATLPNYEKVGLDYLFPGQTRVFAEWYSGEIRIPYGIMLQYVHLGYESLYRKELFLNIEKGVVIGKRKIKNTLSAYKAELKLLYDNLFDDDLCDDAPKKELPKKKRWLYKIYEKLCALWCNKKQPQQ